MATIKSVERKVRGEVITLFQKGKNWLCPACGNNVGTCAPYNESGSASFSMCEVCSFEYGYDDDPDACGKAAEGVAANFVRMRDLIKGKAATDPQLAAKLKVSLPLIGQSL